MLLNHQIQTKELALKVSQMAHPTKMANVGIQSQIIIFGYLMEPALIRSVDFHGTIKIECAQVINDSLEYNKHIIVDLQRKIIDMHLCAIYEIDDVKGKCQLDIRRKSYRVQIY